MPYQSVPENAATWAMGLGLTKFAEWLQEHATGSRIFWGCALLAVAYLLIVFALPALIRRVKKNISIVAVPGVVAVLVVIAAYAGYLAGSPPEPWGLSSQQKLDLKNSLEKETEFATVTIVPVPASAAAIKLAYDLLDIWRSANKWNIYVTPHNAYFSPKDTGLRIAVKPKTDPAKNANAQSVSRVLERAGFKVSYTEHVFLQDGQVILEIGRRP